MIDWPMVTCVLTTYKRTELARRTIVGVHKHLVYPHNRLRWHIADDGSDEGHVQALVEAIPDTVPVTLSNAKRKGVRKSMNMAIDVCYNFSNYFLWLEDDWELEEPFDLRPCVILLGETHLNVGMVRLGYLSLGVEGEVISSAGMLWWRLYKGHQYTFSGHAALRNKAFIDSYHPYREGLRPGETEIEMCTKFNRLSGPDIAYPAYVGIWGPFKHIGGESYKDMVPE